MKKEIINYNMKCKPGHKIAGEFSILLYLYNLFRMNIIEFYLKIYVFIYKYFRKPILKIT